MQNPSKINQYAEGGQWGEGRGKATSQAIWIKVAANKSKRQVNRTEPNRTKVNPIVQNILW